MLPGSGRQTKTLFKFLLRLPEVTGRRPEKALAQKLTLGSVTAKAITAAGGSGC